MDSYQYDYLGLLKSKTSFTKNGIDSFEKYEYTYDKSGKIILVTVIDQSEQIVAKDFYEYDSKFPEGSMFEPLDSVSLSKARLILDELRRDNTREDDMFVVYEGRANDLSAMLESIR